MKIITNILLLIAAAYSIAAPADSILLKGGDLHTAAEPEVQKNTDVLIVDGVIKQIGQGISVDETVKVIDVSGKQLTPGLINASTQLGLVEISAVSGTVDARVKDKNRGASFDISPAINFNSTLFPQNRINGLTHAVVMPGSGEATFNGQGAFISLRSSPSALVKSRILQTANYGVYAANKAGGSRAAAYQALDQALTEAAYLKANENRYLPGFNWQFSQSLADLKALYAVIDRRVPLVIRADRQSDILQLLALAKKHQVRLVIAGGAEAWRVADKLAQAKVPVLMDPMDNLPRSFDALAVRLDGAARLAKAGVKLLFTGQESTHNAYLVRQSAGNAVAYGLDRLSALQAMTINVASTFGIDNLGQLKEGMLADIVVWDGDPLEVTSNAVQVFIEGEAQPMVSRATRLRDRYWDLKNIKNAAYRR